MRAKIVLYGNLYVPGTTTAEARGKGDSTHPKHTNTEILRGSDDAVAHRALVFPVSPLRAQCLLAKLVSPKGEMSKVTKYTPDTSAGALRHSLLASSKLL